MTTSTGQRGTAVYIRAMAALMGKPMIRAELVKAIGADEHGMAAALPVMHRAGLLYVAEWVPSGSMHIARFGLGRRDDAPKPHGARCVYGLKDSGGRASLRHLCAVYVGARQPSSSSDLGKLAGISPAWAKQMVRDLRAAGLMHVCGWRPLDGQGGGPVPIYLAGPGVDVERPEPKSPPSTKRPMSPAQRKATAEEAARQLMLRAHLVRPAALAADDDRVFRIVRPVGEWAVDRASLPVASVWQLGEAV